MKSTGNSFSFIRIAAVTLLVAAMGHRTAAATFAQNWPSWRGPQANGVAPHAQPPVFWSETNHVRWKLTLPGRGTASPVVWDDLVFILTAIPENTAAETSQPKAVMIPEGARSENASATGPRPVGSGRRVAEAPLQKQRFTVLALDRATGKTRWERSPRVQLPHEGHHPDHGFASASPVTDGEVVVASFGSFGVYGFDLKGNVLWEKDLGVMHTRNGFGEGSSPALDGDTVVVLWDHEGSDFIVALDKQTGKERWRRERDEPTGWCTPLVVSHGGRKQVVVNGTRKARSYDLASGELVWECGGQTANAIPSAVADASRVYVMSGFRGSACQAIRLGRQGDLTGTDAIAWSLNKGTPYVPSPLLSDGRLYFYSGNNAQLTIVDASTGKIEVDNARLEGLYGVYASPISAAGRVYLLGRDGGMLVVKDGPVLEVLARNKLDDGFDASPATVGGDLFLRGRENLYCLAEGTKK